eukprot:g5270.t1
MIKHKWLTSAEWNFWASYHGKGLCDSHAGKIAQMGVIDRNPNLKLNVVGIDKLYQYHYFEATQVAGKLLLRTFRNKPAVQFRFKENKGNGSCARVTYCLQYLLSFLYFSDSQREKLWYGGILENRQLGV